eukprot:TRINITY_DN1473_c1_g1_i2.p1 TRINITY_DN1473_c1_g1~~TRINITY_DN1473_c1_g1_i2.p1  ORF type:complete len:159 (+),score=19.76 TRINITY_DN1473_c1_g1_i2:3-479(+)
MPDLDLFLQPKEMLLVLSVFASGAAAAATPFSSSEQTEIVNAHNVIRRAVNPPAQTMPDLVWSSAIATDAQNWADQCNWSSASSLSQCAQLIFLIRPQRALWPGSESLRNLRQLVHRVRCCQQLGWREIKLGLRSKRERRLNGRCCGPLHANYLGDHD